MTFPHGEDPLDAGWQPGERLFRSWILLFGVLPIEFDDLTLVELDRESRFLERSTMLSQKIWEHERRLESVEDGTWLEDRIRFEPRLRFLAPVYNRVFQFLFWFRHRQLAKLFPRDAARTGADLR